MPRSLMLAFAFCLALVGCDSEPGSTPFDPNLIDFDQVQSLDYGDYVQPLLAARNVFAPAATSTPGDLDDYEWDDVFDSDAGWGEAIVPFDADRSLLVRFVRNLADSVAIPYPNLRSLQDDEVEYLARWIEAGARNDDGDVPYADAHHLMYAAVQGDNYVAVIDAERQQVIRTIDFDELGLPSAPYGPHHLFFEHDRSAVYVSLISAGRVVKITGDLSMNPSHPSYVLATSPAGAFDSPGMMALDDEAGRLYVGRSTLSDPDNTESTIGVFDSESLSLVETIAVLGTSFPHALALTPGGQYLLTAPLAGNVAYSFEALTGNLVGQAEVGGGGATRELVHFSVLPEGTSEGFTATLTANNPTSEVLFFTVGSGGALTYDGAVATEGERAWHAHLDRDGETLMVPNRSSNSVTLINVPTRAVTLTADNAGADGPLAAPHSPAPTHDGVFFVSNSNWPTAAATWAPPYPFLDDEGRPLPNEAFGNVACLDPATGEVVKTILLGRYPSGLEHWHEGGHGHDATPTGGHDH